MDSAVVTVRVGKVVRDESSHTTMRVLHVIPSVSERSGGPGLAIVPMCRALQAQGIEVLLITTDTVSRSEDHGGVPAIFFEAQLGESFKYSRPLAAWLNANVQHFNAV